MAASMESSTPTKVTSPCATTTNDDTNNDPHTRLLKRGDLVRVAERRQPGLKNRDGGLGRIVAVKEVQEEDGSHENNNTVRFLYDVQWMLGGKISNVSRWELVHTTATAEGLIDDGTSSTGRSRRVKRKTNKSLEMEQAEKKVAATAAAKKKKCSTTTTTTTSTSSSGKKNGSAAAKKRKTATGAVDVSASRSKSTSASASSGAKKTKRQTPSSLSPVPSVIDDNTNHSTGATGGGLSMFDRHRREFERMVGGLEKKDKYNFFNGDVPPEFDEVYPDSEDEKDEHDNDDMSKSSWSLEQPIHNDNEQQQPNDHNNKDKVSPSIVFPTTPPYNFIIIRKRLKHGRYIIDYAKQEELDRSKAQDIMAITLQNENSHGPDGSTVGGGGISSSIYGTDKLPAVAPTSSTQESNNVMKDDSTNGGNSSDTPKSKKNSKSTNAAAKKNAKKGTTKGTKGKPSIKGSKKNGKKVTTATTKGTKKKPSTKQKKTKKEIKQEEQRLKEQQQEQDEKEKLKKGPQFQILHPLGIDWDTFRDDVVGMCDAAIERYYEEQRRQSLHTDNGAPAESGTLVHSAQKLKDAALDLYQRTGQRHIQEMSSANAKHKYTFILSQTTNSEAAMQGAWRTKAFPERKYERLYFDNTVCDGLSKIDERSAIYELQTSLPDSFVGISYRYDDVGQSEGWMKSIVSQSTEKKQQQQHQNKKKRKKNKDNQVEDEQDSEEAKRAAAAALAADDGVVRAQVRAAMQSMLIEVQDRVMTETRILNDPELRSANWEVARLQEEQDLKRKQQQQQCQEHSMPQQVSSQQQSPSQQQQQQQQQQVIPQEIPSHQLEVVNGEPTVTDAELVEQPVWGIDCYTRRNITMCLEPDYGPQIALDFVEKWLLPAINACPVEIAHNLSNACRILEDLHDNNKHNDELLNTTTGSSIGDSNDSATKGLSGGAEDADIIESGQWSHSLFGRALLDKIQTLGPPWLKVAAKRIRTAKEEMGSDYFRIHPKGHGSVVLQKNGIPANSLVTYYRGEVYPPWRWGEKMDAIEMTQQKKKLRPNLPDFYNMALERPQSDPRGYGLLFVDASRKAGHGSSLSHSCEPTCEVRVAAVNGQLCLAMTTLRDVEQGEELTFDYNAVTESLNEYQTAVCLCGHGKCRGSFLHFATADCYQQVLSRNCPIAVRLSSLVKGSMKKVMSEYDEKILRCHGFGTAAFGAISFNHHNNGSSSDGGGKSSKKASTLDSIDNVPIWLRTYVADTLRYIEYERRALPIALLCNEFTPPSARKKKSSSPKDVDATAAAKTSDGASGNAEAEAEMIKAVDELNKTMKGLQKAIPGSKPKPVFMYFAENRKEIFTERLHSKGITNLTALKLQSALKQEASAEWNEFTAEEKQEWKDRAYKEWKASGGEERARLDEERKLKLRDLQSGKLPLTNGTDASTTAQASGSSSGKEKTKNPEASKQRKKPKKNEKNSKKDKTESVCASKISFEAADAEGIQAMEQRIQQLTQSLSRVGRVLDRHRELVFGSTTTSKTEKTASPTLSTALGSKIHSPVTVLQDEQIIRWMWNVKNGVVKSFLKGITTLKCASPALKKSLHAVEKKYSALEAFGGKKKKAQTMSVTSNEARRLLTSALLEFRDALLEGVTKMEQDIQMFEVDKIKWRNNKKKEEIKKKRDKDREVKRLAKEKARGIDPVVSVVVREMVNTVVERSKAKGKPAPMKKEIAKENSNPQSDRDVVSSLLTEMLDTVEHRCSNKTKKVKKKKPTKDDSNPPKLSSWLKYLPEDRGKLMAAADLLLIYARTSTFFVIKPYMSLESTPIEVYARELGNAVPKKVVDDIALTDPKEPTAPKLDEPDATKESPVIAECLNGDVKMEDMSGMNSKAASDSNKDVKYGTVADFHPSSKITKDCASKCDDQNASAEENEEFIKSCALKNGRTEEQQDEIGDTRDENVIQGQPTNDTAQDEIPEMESLIDESQMKLDERFNVLRTGKEKFQVGIIVDVDLDGDVKRVKFHFPKMHKKFDEWVEVGSERIKPLSEANKPLPKVNTKKGPRVSKKKPITKGSSEAISKEVEEKICKPDDIITNVVVKYDGDYVLSQLLQWYNGGIGQKPGMPDILGCSMLPPMSGCLPIANSARAGSDDGKKKEKEKEHQNMADDSNATKITPSKEETLEKGGKADSKTTKDAKEDLDYVKKADSKDKTKVSYEEVVRPLLVEWFEDPHKRGNPWPEEIRKSFECPGGTSDEWIPLGSPILDLLVTGDDTNIQQILHALNPTDELEKEDPKSNSKKKRKTAAEKLQSSVDEGMPAQGIANWVQCENPDCHKWRKVPWHVDIDNDLPDKFYCKDNKWNPAASSCDSPEDTWDENDETLNKTGVSPVKAKLMVEKKNTAAILDSATKSKSKKRLNLDEPTTTTARKKKKKKITKPKKTTETKIPVKKTVNVLPSQNEMHVSDKESSSDKPSPKSVQSLSNSQDKKPLTNPISDEKASVSRRLAFPEAMRGATQFRKGAVNPPPDPSMYLNEGVSSTYAGDNSIPPIPLKATLPELQ